MADVSHAVQVNVTYAPVVAHGVSEQEWNTFLVGHDGHPQLRLGERSWPQLSVERLLAHISVPLNTVSDRLSPAEAKYVVGGGFHRYETHPMSTALVVAAGVLAAMILAVLVLTGMGFL